MKISESDKPWWKPDLAPGDTERVARHGLLQLLLKLLLGR